jgi:hypothetical protein
MPQEPQTALERYKSRRTGEALNLLPPSPPTPQRQPAQSPAWLRVALLGTLAAVLALAVDALWPGGPPHANLVYEIDLAEAPAGIVVVKLEARGDLPRRLHLTFPPGVFNDTANGVTPHTPTASELGEDGGHLRSLALERGEDGWEVATAGVQRASFTYRVDLTRTSGQEEDIRRYISTPVAGGVRAAGYELFLAPRGLEVGTITVTIWNPGDLPVLVPWPPLTSTPRVPGDAGSAADSVAAAHLGAGQGYEPAGGLPPVAPRDPGLGLQRRTAPFPPGRNYRPRDLRDLHNSLLVCGDIRTATTEVRDCTIQYATDREWTFDDETALDLVRRIARTEIAFFGSAPTTPITVLLAANEVTAAEGFDAYGVHTGSSILVLIDPAATWGEIEEQAASVIAHEMFHGWLGEAVPQSDPTMLWFTEGATTWFAARMLTAAGIWSPHHARSVLSARIERDYRGSPLLGETAVADAAAEVMAEARQVRFAYAGGVAACMALDDWLAVRSGISRPLDAVLRRLYDTRDGRALTRESLQDAVLAVTGVNCAWWLDEHVYGKTALPPSDRLI